MGAPKRAERAVLPLAVLLLAVSSVAPVHAAVPTLTGGEIKLSADVVNSDPRNDVHVMSGNVRVTQGAMSMEAEQATATDLQSDHSRWTFERSVHITTADADLKSNSASAVFAGGQLTEAVIKGSPASFEQRNPSADKNVRGRANVIEYDFAKGTVKLTDNVWFNYGGNEFRGNTVVYDLKDERVTVNSAGVNTDGKAPGRVNITIRPGTGQIIPGLPDKPADEPPDKPTDKPPGNSAKSENNE